MKMDWKYISWIVILISFIINIFGLFNVFILTLATLCFVLGFLSVIYIQHEPLDSYFDKLLLVNPLEKQKNLGLNFDTKQNGEYLLTAGGAGGAADGKKWKPLENIKIYTERRKVYDSEPVIGKPILNKDKEISHDIDPNVLDEHGSPKRKTKTILSGKKQIDQHLHTLIDYILRDYIESWFCSLSDNKEFSEYRTRNSIEECIQNLCKRIKCTQWIPLLCTKLVDDVATHCRLYRIANEAISEKSPDAKSRLSPQKRIKKDQHRRNKSDTDLGWYLGNAAVQKNVANSKFYTEPPDENTLIDPEAKMVNAFFSTNDLFHNECTNDVALEKYLTHVMETILYFTLSEEDFSCLPLRTFLTTLLANAVCKPLIEMFSDPDMINLQITKLFAKETPQIEFFIKMIRQCTDLSELRACRQFIIKEMDSKYKNNSNNNELRSLKYVQKLIDLRLSHLQSNKSEATKIDREKANANLPILPLDELLTKELALSYYLDYLSILNLQKYVIFYLTAQEWKASSVRCIADIKSNKMKGSKDEILKVLRDKANNIYNEYLMSQSTNCLNIDQGLIEALGIKIKDTSIVPDTTWFDSICKYVYEKLKNEDIFLNNFYQSSAYKKLLLELECDGIAPETDIDPNLSNFHLNLDNGSDSNSGDIAFDDDTDDEQQQQQQPQQTTSKTVNNSDSNKYLTIAAAANVRHSRSHSDCTGMQSISDISNEIIAPFDETITEKGCESIDGGEQSSQQSTIGQTIGSNQSTTPTISAKIINTAIHCEGKYAVYAIQVCIIDGMQQRCWHIYRRYSRFLDLKKALVKKYPPLAQIPFPAKKAFQNTQRSVLEHRMIILNEFLKVICERSSQNAEIRQIIRVFLEPDKEDKTISGGTGLRTVNIETLVNPIRSGMKTFINMPDTVVGGIMKLLLGKGPMKETSFLDVTPIQLEQSSEYPALTSALNLLDELFDLQARSQWLRRGIINRLLGAPWISHAANKKIIHAARNLIEMDRIDQILQLILNALWPNGKQQKSVKIREDNCKLRTRMAAKITLFSFLFDDLKHVVGSETTRYGLLTFFSMLQNRKLNRRLILVMLNSILKTMYQTDSMDKHLSR